MKPTRTENGFRSPPSFLRYQLEKTMATKQQEEQHPTPPKQERQQLNDAIGRHVIRSLGQPGDLERVQVRHLWDDHYRVNVFIGMDAASARVANSFFLVVDHEGNILTSNPKITKQYHPAADK
jgi:hypothetical protein